MNHRKLIWKLCLWTMLDKKSVVLLYIHLHPKTLSCLYKDKQIHLSLGSIWPRNKSVASLDDYKPHWDDENHQHFWRLAARPWTAPLQPPFWLLQCWRLVWVVVEAEAMGDSVGVIANAGDFLLTTIVAMGSFTKNDRTCTFSNTFFMFFLLGV